MQEAQRTTAQNHTLTRRIWRVTRSALLDVVITWAAFLAVFFTRAVTTSLDLELGFYSLLAVTFVNLVALYSFGVYDRIWSRTSGHGVTVLIYAVVAATVVLSLADIIFSPRPVPLSVLLVGNMLALVGYVGIRYRSRLISGLTWRWRAVWHHEFPRSDIRILIIGAGNSGQTLALRMRYPQRDASYKIVGYIDDDPGKQGLYVEGYRILGTRQQIKELVETRHVDLIAFAIHNIEGDDFREILSICEQTKAKIKVVPDILADLNDKSAVALLRDVQADDLLGRSEIARHEGVDLSPVEQKVILVTGAAGSIGSELSRQIVTYEPVRVILLDNNESGLHDLLLDLQERHPEVELIPALVDISLCDELHRVFARYRPQVVFHAAAYKHVPMLEHSPHEALRVNVRGTANLMALAHEFAVERFVFISTDKAVNPTSVMGASKRLGELMLHASALEGASTRFAAVRFGNVLGSRGSVVPTFTRQIQHGGPITITDEQMTRYFMTIPEAANLIIHAACITEGDDIYLLKMGETVRIVDLAERMIRMRGLRPYVDIAIVSTGIRPGEKLHEELFAESEAPMPTVHPGIVQLKSWQPGFDSQQFRRQTEDLLTQPGDGPEVLRRIMQVINGSNGHGANGHLHIPVPAESSIDA